MSAIGGIISLTQSTVDTQILSAMSRSLLLRGRDSRCAYVHNGIGIFQNRMLTEEPSAAAQPLIENGCSVVVDGWIEGKTQTETLDSAKIALDTYLTSGSENIGTLQGSFSLAICDERRGELLLARDAIGSRPLYYIAEQDRLVFASEIKALLRALDSAARVELDRLRAHILAPCGSYAGESLYQSICALPPAHTALYSRLGCATFSYQSSQANPTDESLPNGLASPFVCPDKDSLRRILTEVLFAFDYPQFDHLMPAFLRTLSLRSAEQTTRTMPIEDAALWISLPYARERADRLSRGFGTHAVSIPPHDWSIPPKALRRFTQLLSELLDELDPTRIRYLFGDDFRTQIEREKNLGKRIRMQGLLYQALLWEEHYPIRFV